MLTGKLSLVKDEMSEASRLELLRSLYAILSQIGSSFLFKQISEIQQNVTNMGILNKVQKF